MSDDFKKRFEYLMSLSNKELRKEIENSNWNFILQELRYAGDEIDRLNNIISEFESWAEDWFKDVYAISNGIVYEEIMGKLKELKEK